MPPPAKISLLSRPAGGLLGVLRPRRKLGEQRPLDAALRKLLHPYVQTGQVKLGRGAVGWDVGQLAEHKPAQRIEFLVHGQVKVQLLVNLFNGCYARNAPRVLFQLNDF